MSKFKLKTQFTSYYWNFRKIINLKNIFLFVFILVTWVSWATFIVFGLINFIFLYLDFGFKWWKQNDKNMVSNQKQFILGWAKRFVGLLFAHNKIF